MASRILTNIIAALYLLLGVALFFSVPEFNALYQSLYAHWESESAFLIRAFFLPPFVWPLLFSFPAALLYYLGLVLSAPQRKRLNILALLVWPVLLVHILDWLYRYVFCHVWGCSPWLPTWRWLS